MKHPKNGQSITGQVNMAFRTLTAILVLPELLMAVDADREELSALEQGKAAAKSVNKAARKQAERERRSLKVQLRSRKIYFHCAVAGLVFIGLIYYVWMLMQDRTMLLPYLTFFQS